MIFNSDEVSLYYKDAAYSTRLLTAPKRQQALSSSIEREVVNLKIGASRLVPETCRRLAANR